MKHPHIPRTWTGPEALAIVEALEAAVDAIFDVYRAEIRVELLAREMERDALIPTAAPAPPRPSPPTSPRFDLHAAPGTIDRSRPGAEFTE